MTRKVRFMKRLAAGFLILLAACDAFSAPEVTEPLTEDALLEHLDYLAGDSLYGRGSGTEYELEAAQYIRDEFEDYGLVPGVAGWLQPFTYELGSGRVQLETSQNVLGVLPGRGSLSEQWVILGAHYDHIGFTRVSSDSIVIYNGADDNASGTALLLEVARYLSHYFNEGETQSSDRRSLMFQAYGSEEVGLRGSIHFVSNSIIPLDSITAMLNLDMVGRLRDGDLMAIGGTSSPLWETLLSEKNEADLDLIIPTVTTGRSDHAPFYYQRIPVLFFHTGTHDQYHAPDDDVWLINTAGMVTVGNLAIAVLTDLLLRAEPPAFLY